MKQHQNFQRPKGIISIDGALDLINSKQPLVWLLGAGISSAANIPTYQDSKDLSSSLNISVFKQDPISWWNTVWLNGHKRILSNDLVPTRAHLALAHSPPSDYIVTQNIDNLEIKANINPEQLSQVHGSAHHYTCLQKKCRDIRVYCPNPTQPILCPNCQNVTRPSVLLYDEFYGDVPNSRFGKAKKRILRHAIIIMAGTRAMTGIGQLPFRKPNIIISINKEPNHNCLSLLGTTDDLIPQIVEYRKKVWTSMISKDVQIATE